jgi:transcriptional regulator with XRE-family HTH domain
MGVSPPLSAAVDVTQILGMQIRAARISRRMAQAELAERIDVSVATIRKIERGDTGVAIGSTLSAAVIVGVPLMSDESQRASQRRHLVSMLTLMNRRVREPARDFDYDF